LGYTVVNFGGQIRSIRSSPPGTPWTPNHPVHHHGKTHSNAWLAV